MKNTEFSLTPTYPKSKVYSSLLELTESKFVLYYGTAVTQHGYVCIHGLPEIGFTVTFIDPFLIPEASSGSEGEEDEGYGWGDKDKMGQNAG